MHARIWGALAMWLVAVPLAWASTYYVSPAGSDSAGGSEAAPFRTIAQGVRHLQSGDTLYLRGGTYNEDLVFSKGELPNGGGSWATATTIAGYPGEKAVVKPPPPSGPQFGVLNLGEGGGFNWMVFDNLTLDGTVSGGNVVSLGGDSHHIRISYSDLFRLGPRGGEPKGGTGIHGGGSSHEFLGNHIHDLGGYGAYWSGNNSVFDGNTFDNIGGFAIHMYNTGAHNVSDNVVRNNHIFNNGKTYFCGSVLLSHGTNNQAYNNTIEDNGCGVAVDHGCVDCQVYNNTIRNNGSYGVMIGDLYPTETHGTVVRNNIITGSPTAIYNPHGSQAIVEGNTTDGGGVAPAGVGAQPGAVVGEAPAPGTEGAGPGSGPGETAASPRPSTALFAVAAPS
jgi:hypothetical protein